MEGSEGRGGAGGAWRGAVESGRVGGYESHWGERGRGRRG